MYQKNKTFEEVSPSNLKFIFFTTTLPYSKKSLNKKIEANILFSLRLNVCKSFPPDISSRNASQMSGVGHST